MGVGLLRRREAPAVEDNWIHQFLHEADLDVGGGAPDLPVVAAGCSSAALVAAVAPVSVVLAAFHPRAAAATARDQTFPAVGVEPAIRLLSSRSSALAGPPSVGTAAPAARATFAPEASVPAAASAWVKPAWATPASAEAEAGPVRTVVVAAAAVGRGSLMELQQADAASAWPACPRWP